MTLNHRNRCFIAGIAAGAVAFAAVAAAAFVILPAYPEALDNSIRRSAGILQRFLANFSGPRAYAPFAATAGSIAYSLLGIILVYVYFEKTQSPEILFMGFYIMSYAFECIRLIVPLKIVINLPNNYLIQCTRLLFFGRYFGLFSLFSASLCSAGLEIQKQQNFIFISAAAALIFAVGIPVDTLSWDSSLVLLNDFASIFFMVQAGILIITIVSFFVSIYTRGSRDYILIGAGALLTYAGRNLLFNADTWPGAAFGLAFLGLGTWFICTKFHRIYLWL